MNYLMLETRPLEIAPGPHRTLEVLRGFSGVLTQTLNAQEMLKQFLLQLREILGVNRAAIFLRPPTGTASARGDRGLLSACAIGVAPGLLEHFTLTLQSGIGAHLHRQGRILQREGPAAQADREIQREFELLGAQVAVPIFDHQSLIGAAVFDGRLTGQRFTNDELNQVFQLLEQLGLAIKNTWAHDQLAASHQMMADILSQLESACLVVGADLKLLHANRAAREYFLKPGGARTELEFGDLPQALGSKVFQVLNTGLGLEPFKYRLPGVEVNTFQVVIVPFKRQSAASPNAAMLLMEDITQSERSQQLEIETANLRLVKSMAERLAHEIGNAIVPLSTHEQLLKQKFADPEFRASLAAAMGESVKRISRLAKQMFFLARETFERSDVVPLQQLVEEAFKEAQNFHSGKVARLHLDTGAQRLSLSVEKGGIRHALSEVMLNALQASSGDSLVSVNAHSKTDAAGQSWTQIEVSDPGAGFGLESARQALNPFYTTRSVGIGLGLTVARKIIEMHHGRIEIAPAEKNHPSTVIISLPNN